MNDPRGFLERWSRRKLEADREREPAAAPLPEIEPTPESAPPAAGEGATAEEGTAPACELASLPPIDSISADTDIRSFFLPGVPEALKQAALRRAWTADPAIRDFVGLAENAWDFNAPDSMPGFGPLQMTDALRNLVARGMSGVAKTIAAREAPEALGPEAEDASEISGRPLPSAMAPPSAAEGGDAASEPAAPFEDAQSGKSSPEKVITVIKNNDSPKGRARGGALPR